MKGSHMRVILGTRRGMRHSLSKDIVYRLPAFSIDALLHNIYRNADLTRCFLEHNLGCHGIGYDGKCVIIHANIYMYIIGNYRFT